MDKKRITTAPWMNSYSMSINPYFFDRLLRAVSGVEMINSTGWPVSVSRDKLWN